MSQFPQHYQQQPPQQPHAGQRPSSQRRYVFDEHGNSEVGQRQGRYIIKNNLAEHWTPAFGDGGTTIRILPVPNVDDPTGQTFEPYRFNSGPGGFGDWIRRYPAVRSMGDPGVTFLTGDPANDTGEGSDAQMRPGNVLYNAIERAVANGQDQPGWAAMLKGGPGRSPMLSKPSEVYLVQCCIARHKNQVYNPPRGIALDHRLCVMELSTSAGQALLTQLNQVREGYQGPEGDWERQMLNGDPVSIDFGRFVTFYKLADGDPRQAAVQQQTNWNMQSRPQGQGRQQEPIGYGCFLEHSFNGTTARLTGYEHLVRAKVTPWDRLLHFPTIEEQAALLADKFPPEVICYAWRNHPDWIPEAVRHRAVGHMSVQVPAGVPPMPSAPPAGPGWGAPQQGYVPPAAPYAPPPLAGPPPVPMHTPGYQQPSPYQQPQQQQAQGYPPQQPSPYPQQPPAPGISNWGSQANPAASLPGTPVQDPALHVGTGIPAGMPANAAPLPPQAPYQQAPAYPTAPPPPASPPSQHGWGQQASPAQPAYQPPPAYQLPPAPPQPAYQPPPAPPAQPAYQPPPAPPATPVPAPQAWGQQPPPAQPQQQGHVQQPAAPQGYPQQQPPQQGQPLSRGEQALLAAQRAVGGQPPQQ